MNPEKNLDPNTRRRCIECFVEYPHDTNHPFLVCDTCQQRGLVLSLNEQSFVYRKTTSGRSFTERQGEMIRKMGQGRLDRTIQVYDVYEFEWQWIPVNRSIYFAGTAIAESTLSGAIEQRQQSDRKQRSQQKWTARIRLLTAFVVMSTVLGVAYTGWERDWFVINADPFAVEQGQDSPIPDDLEMTLKNGVKRKESQTFDIEEALVDRTQWSRVEEVLQYDLSQNPRQGTELLQWLQVKILTHEPTVSDNPFPAKWLQFALSLHHPEELGHRVKAMWYLLQGDRQAMVSALQMCSKDQWCLAYTQAMTRSLEDLETSIAIQLAGEYALSFEQVESFESLSSKAKEYGLTNLQALLAAESALQNLDVGTSAKWVNDLQDSEYTTLRLALWNQRLNPSNPVSVSKTTKSKFWTIATPQTRGAWALEQAGAWLKADDTQANERIEEWFASGDWFQGDFENAVLPDRFQLIRAQSAMYAGDVKKALEHLGKIQSSFDDPLLNLWLGLQWVQVDSLQNAISIAESMSSDTPHHWMLKAVIAVQSKNAELLTQALDRIARTDLSLLSERTLFQTWVPSFNWSNVLSQAEEQFQSGNIQSHYRMVLEWLKGKDPNIVRHADGWPTAWIVRAQYAYEMGRYNEAQTFISRFRRLEADSVPGEILSQLINIKIGRADIAKRELGLIAQRERSSAWGHWFSVGFQGVNALALATEARHRWYPVLPTRNISADQFFLFDELPHD